MLNKHLMLSRLCWMETAIMFQLFLVRYFHFNALCVKWFNQIFFILTFVLVWKIAYRHAGLCLFNKRFEWSGCIPVNKKLSSYPSTVFFLLFFSCPCSSKIVWYEKFLPFFFLLWGGEYLLFDFIAQVKDISLHFSCFVGGKLEELKGDIDHLFPYRMLVSFHLRLLYDLFNLSHS